MQTHKFLSLCCVKHQNGMIELMEEGQGRKKLWLWQGVRPWVHAQVDPRMVWEPLLACCARSMENCGVGVCWRLPGRGWAGAQIDRSVLRKSPTPKSLQQQNKQAFPKMCKTSECNTLLRTGSAQATRKVANAGRRRGLGTPGNVWVRLYRN